MLLNVLPSAKLTFQPIEALIQRTVVLKGAPLHVHVHLEECSWPNQANRFFEVPATVPALRSVLLLRNLTQVTTMQEPCYLV